MSSDTAWLPPRPRTPEQVHLLMVQQQTVGRHPVADLNDACSQPTGTRCNIVAPTCQIQLRVVGVEVNVDVVFGGDVGQFCCVRDEQQRS